MDTVVGLGRLQIGNRPFPVIGSSNGNRHVNVMAAEAAKGIVLLVSISTVSKSSSFQLYLSITGLCVLWVLQGDIVMRDKVEGSLAVVQIALKD